MALALARAFRAGRRGQDAVLKDINARRTAVAAKWKFCDLRMLVQNCAGWVNEVNGAASGAPDCSSPRESSMLEHHIDIKTADGQMNTFITHPEEPGRYPVVLFYMDAPGKRDELHDMARRIGTVGYYVVLPNLYYRRDRDFEMAWDEEGRKRMFDHMYSLSIPMVMRDTQAMLDYVRQAPAADGGRVGAVGYCMSGPFVLAAASQFPADLKCAASIYGAGLVTDRDDSPHLHAARAKGELYFACAETDVYAPREVISKLELALAASGANYRLEWYPGTHHGFAFPQRKAVYDHTSAERHWERLFALFRRNLDHAG
jgi:carboxymethylenebutenolidase